MYPHRIRLRGPWDCELLPAGDSTQHVRCRRRFGFPGRIDADERVWLTFSDVPGKSSLSLNGTELVRDRELGPSFAVETTALLQARNELIVENDSAEAGIFQGEVAMEVRRTAYLDNVSITYRDNLLCVEGEVCGEATIPLELYAIAGRSTTAYATVKAGDSFKLRGEPQTHDFPLTVRIDLVNGAVVWYTLERVLDISAPKPG